MEEPQNQTNMVWYANYSSTAEGIVTHSSSQAPVQISGEISNLNQVQIQYSDINNINNQHPHIIISEVNAEPIIGQIKPVKVSKARGSSNTERVPCENCGKTFSCNANLRDHLRLHTGERPFSCSECGMAFAQRSNWRLHKRVHTGEKPYMCGICGKTFARSSHLPGHMRVHTGERPYACDSCDQTFTSGQALKNHIRTHTGEKPYVCEFCYTPFTHSSSLSSHKKRCTGEKRKRGRPLGTGHRCVRKKSQINPKGKQKKRKMKSKKLSSNEDEISNVVGLVVNGDVSEPATNEKNDVELMMNNEAVEISVEVIGEDSIKMEEEFILGLDEEHTIVSTKDMVHVAASAAGLDEQSDLHQEAAVTMATLGQRTSLRLLPTTILYPKH